VVSSAFWELEQQTSCLVTNATKCYMSPFDVSIMHNMIAQIHLQFIEFTSIKDIKKERKKEKKKRSFQSHNAVLQNFTFFNQPEIRWRLASNCLDTVHVCTQDDLVFIIHFRERGRQMTLCSSVRLAIILVSRGNKYYSSMQKSKCPYEQTKNLWTTP
jgi:hypothetical protein